MPRSNKLFWVFAALIALLLVPPAIAQKSNSTMVLPPEYEKWLDEDVRHIIADEERAEFARLTTDQQRDAFVVAFWEHRNPNPGSEKNIFKKEHYRRLAYANIHFAANVPGYKTDRGRIYIMYGPPNVGRPPLLGRRFRKIQQHCRCTYDSLGLGTLALSLS